MKLTKKIANKYNRLYLEVAEYYGLQDMVVQSSLNKLYYINITHFGCSTDKSPSTVLSHLQFMFPYISDFYKIFHNDVFEITERDFDMINYNVEKIREEKSAIKK